MALTPQQKLFVAHYVASPDLNATEAYRKAYPKCKARSAHANAARLMANASVKAAIAAAMKEREERCRTDADYVVQGLRREAERDGKGASHSARVQAFIALGKHLGMFVERHEHTGKGGGPIKYADATDDDLDAEITRLQGV